MGLSRVYGVLDERIRCFNALKRHYNWEMFLSSFSICFSFPSDDSAPFTLLGYLVTLHKGCLYKLNLVLHKRQGNDTGINDEIPNFI